MKPVQDNIKIEFRELSIYIGVMNLNENIVVNQLREFIPFVQSLVDLEDEIWFRPLGEDKWRIHDIVTHIMRWDVYFNEVTFPSIHSVEKSELKEHPNYLEYNEQSINYGRNKTKIEIIEETIRSRKRMINNLKEVGDSTFLKVFPGERGFSLKSYLEEFFTSHDKHHREQIEQFIKCSK
jgi:hypothetical protein